MKQIFFFLIIFTFSFYGAFGQEKFENKQYGFSMTEPDNWIEADNSELLRNLEKFELNEDNLTKFISDRKGSVLLTSYYKYNPKTYAGLIPTIQVNVRTNLTRDFNEFTSLITQSANSFKQYFEDFSFEIEPMVVEISGIDSIYFVGKFTMKGQNGELIKVRSRTYAVPYGNYFFQLNFTDGQEEDSSELFEILMQTVKIGR